MFKYYYIIILLIITTIHISVHANLIQDIPNKFQVLQTANNQLEHYRANLQIFISTSMPPILIKQYAKEAVLYNATLMIRGLPNNSFTSLTKLVRSISPSNDPIAQIQIDDEAFVKFDITKVPTIILSKNTDESTPLKEDIIYDKVVGNIGIKKALEIIADNGDLALDATNLLRRISNNTQIYQ